MDPEGGPAWLERLAVELFHAESIADHGGMPSLREEARLESALARPRNLHAYEGITDVLTLAACCAVAIARNHPFMDGNKRMAFVAAMVFAQQNGFRAGYREIRRHGMARVLSNVSRRVRIRREKERGRPALTEAPPPGRIPASLGAPPG